MFVIVLYLLILPLVGITHLICWAIRWSKRSGRSDQYITRLKRYMGGVIIYLIGLAFMFLLKSLMDYNTQQTIIPAYLTVVPAIFPIYYWWKIATRPWSKSNSEKGVARIEEFKESL